MVIVALYTLGKSSNRSPRNFDIFVKLKTVRTIYFKQRYCIIEVIFQNIIMIYQFPEFVSQYKDSVTKWIKSRLLPCFGTFKMPILKFICIPVFRPEGQIWNNVRRDTRIYVRRILNSSRISKTQFNSCTISPS